jgi:hypothetical protein
MANLGIDWINFVLSFFLMIYNGQLVIPLHSSGSIE